MRVGCPPSPSLPHVVIYMYMAWRIARICRTVVTHSKLHSVGTFFFSQGATFKHLQQMSSILGHMNERGVLGEGLALIEFGAGRAQLLTAARHAIGWATAAGTCVETRRGSSFSEPSPPLFPPPLPWSSQTPRLTLLRPSDYIAIERMTRIRHRTDKYHRQEPADAVRFERYVVDIEHLALEKLPLLQDDAERKPIVACSKHLCGAATGTVEGHMETPRGN